MENIDELTDAAFAAGYAEMAPARRKKCDAYRFTDDKKRCVLADMLVRRELARLTGCRPEEIQIRLSDTGKPYVDDAGIFFSVSHAGRLAGAAFADREVGFDIEQIRPSPANLTKFFCTDADKTYIFGALPPEGDVTDPETLRRFFEVWTYKEAFAKLSGEGFTKRLKTVDFDKETAVFSYPEGYVICTLTQADL